MFLLSVYEADGQRREALKRARQDALLMARAQAEMQAAILNQTIQMLSGLATAGFALDERAAPKECSVALKRIVTGRCSGREGGG